MDLKTLFNKATNFRKQAQVMSAQPSDVQDALENAKLWNLSTVVSPMLNQVGVSDDATVNISIMVDVGPKVGFNVVLDPKNPKVSAALAGMLKQKFGMPMVNAIKTAKLNVAGLLVINWLKF